MLRAAAASPIVKTYALASGGAGLITAPFLGMAALTALHLSLIRGLSVLYGVEFSKESARGILLALGVAFVPGWLHDAGRNWFGPHPAATARRSSA